jgi:hypothetical protein
VDEIFGFDNKAVKAAYYLVINRATGNYFIANAMNTWTIKEGTTTHFLQGVDTATMNK